MKAPRTLAVTLLAGAAVLAPATAASADHIASKDACKNGGWANIVNPDTGSAYQNQGQCVSAYNQGQKASPASTAT